MSDDSATDCHTRARTAGCVVAALVFLRLCVGWHFFSEGAKKFSYDEGRDEWTIAAPVEGFFRGAKGPLAGLLQRQLPGDHDWQSLLAVPKQMTPQSDQQLKDWVSDYVQRRQRELKSAKPTDTEIPEFAPYANWAEEISNDWRALHKRFADLSALSDEQREQSAKLFERRSRSLADYLAGESLDIQAYQHELWRLESARIADGADGIPFEEDRIAQKSAQTLRTPLKWAGAIKVHGEEFANDLRSVLTDEQRGSAISDRAEEALTSPKARRLRWMSVAVSCLVFGVGFCLLAGLFTRIAAIAGALFLLSVMATQPPWVAGADFKFFYYQLTEFAAFLLLAAASAGRWLGFDYITHALWTKCCGAKATKK